MLITVLIYGGSNAVKSNNVYHKIIGGIGLIAGILFNYILWKWGKIILEEIEESKGEFNFDFEFPKREKGKNYEDK
jgi:hypothetical protein